MFFLAKIDKGALTDARCPEKHTPRQRLYSVNEAAVYLGMSPVSVRYLIQLGHLPFVRLGEWRIYLDIDDLDLIIRERKEWRGSK